MIFIPSSPAPIPHLYNMHNYLPTGYLSFIQFYHFLYYYVMPFFNISMSIFNIFQGVSIPVIKEIHTEYGTLIPKIGTGIGIYAEQRTALLPFQYI